MRKKSHKTLTLKEKNAYSLIAYGGKYLHGANCEGTSHRFYTGESMQPMTNAGKCVSSVKRGKMCTQQKAREI